MTDFMLSLNTISFSRVMICYCFEMELWERLTGLHWWLANHQPPQLRKLRPIPIQAGWSVHVYHIPHQHCLPVLNFKKKSQKELIKMNEHWLYAAHFSSHLGMETAILSVISLSRLRAGLSYRSLVHTPDYFWRLPLEGEPESSGCNYNIQWIQTRVVVELTEDNIFVKSGSQKLLSDKVLNQATDGQWTHHQHPINSPNISLNAQTWHS